MRRIHLSCAQPFFYSRQSFVFPRRVLHIDIVRSSAALLWWLQKKQLDTREFRLLKPSGFDFAKSFDGAAMLAIHSDGEPTKWFATDPMNDLWSITPRPALCFTARARGP
jgi:hypothetical protein